MTSFSNNNHENFLAISLATKISVFDAAGFMLETKAPTLSVRRILASIARKQFGNDIY